MKKEIIVQLHGSFEKSVHKDTDTGTEFWFARDLQNLLGYSKWENFAKVIEKVISIARNDNRFVIKQIKIPRQIGSGATRNIIDYRFNNEAVSLIKNMTGASKPVSSIRLRNETFIIKQLKKFYESKKISVKFQHRVGSYIYDCLVGEKVLFEFDEPHHRNKRQSQIDKKKNDTARKYHYQIVRATIEDDIIDIIIRLDKVMRQKKQQSFGRIRSKGDKALFGGKSTEQMKDHLRVPKGRPLADFLPTITIKAKDFANEITNFTIKRDDMRTEEGITVQHVKNNREVRNILVKRNIKPEALPPAEDVRKVERRLISEERKLLGHPEPLEPKQDN